MDTLPDRASRIKAWGVHFFTATGLVVGFWALVQAYSGKTYEVVFWLLLTVLIDGIDGTFARRFRVKEVLPRIDGRMLDFVVDFVNFVITPCVVFYQMKMVPEVVLFPAVAGILYASMYHYANRENVTEDMHFLGFPAFWNLVIYYLFILDLDPWSNFAITLVMILLHFLPVKILYPSRMQYNKWPAAAAILILVAANAAILAEYPHVDTGMKIAAVAPLLFLGMLGSIKRELFLFGPRTLERNE